MVYDSTNGQTRSRDPQANNPSTTNHMEHNSMTNTNNGKTRTRPSDKKRYLGRINQVQIGVESMPTNGGVQPNLFADFKLTGTGATYINHLDIVVALTNNDAVTGFTPEVGTSFWERIEFMPSGSAADDILYPEPYYFDVLLRQQFGQKINRSASIGMQTARFSDKQPPDTTADMTSYDEDQRVIGPGETNQFIVELPCMFNQGKFFMPGQRQNPRIRMYFQQNPFTTYTDPSLNGKVVFTNMQMIITGPLLNASIVGKLQQHYSAGPSFSRVFVHDRQLTDISTMAPFSQLNDQTLTVFNGEYAFFVLGVRRNNSTKQQLYGSNVGVATSNDAPYITLDFISTNDSSGNPVGFNNTPANYFREVLPSYACPNTAVFTYKQFYLLPYCTDVMCSLLTGENTGGVYQDGNWTIQLTAGNFTPGTETGYTMTIWGWRYALLNRSAKGSFSVQKL